MSVPQNLRILARLDLKGDSVIKGFQMEGLKKKGNPRDFAMSYFDQGIDEIFVFDTVASLYKREAMYDLIQDLAMSFMVPITVAGGIKDLEQARKMFHAGADRIGINTGAVKNPKLLSEIARTYGVQAVVLSLEVKKIALGWQIYGDAGRNELGYSLTEWLSMVPMESIGEILVTCVDTDGTLAGFPRDLLKEFDSHNKPIILSGGISSGHEIVSLAKLSPLVRGVAIGLALHDKHIEIPALKSFLISENLEVRL